MEKTVELINQFYEKALNFLNKKIIMWTKTE